MLNLPFLNRTYLEEVLLHFQRRIFCLNIELLVLWSPPPTSTSTRDMSHLLFHICSRYPVSVPENILILCVGKNGYSKNEFRPSYPLPELKVAVPVSGRLPKLL